ncbi:RING/U-box superfamily protein [Quillaja saponaria]|uniref:RING/U-box superfamily protein n=1 Tax=Quillaja saponaria TaxID=32244 RepID=A0AAD7L5N9_QUISA|nr:RING/U-box superfamily protein [Quillaja saponaria]
MDHYRKAWIQFFTMWFVVGNLWIFRGHSSASDAPKLYRLCVVLLTIGYFGLALIFVHLCATICCCLPCSIGEDLPQTREATLESINAMPTYKFKLKKNDVNEQFNTGIEEGGVFAAGTEKERAISREDAVCCICLANYADGDELRELPCCHVFHGECVNKWLKMSTYCPLCRSVVSKRLGVSTLATHSIQHWIEDI